MADRYDGNAPQGSTYWRSLQELHAPGGIDEAKAHEFMAGVTGDFSPESLPPLSRKKFLALLTASAAVAAAGCSGYRDKGEIVPYTRKPEEIIPGVAAFYASTCTQCAQRCGMLVKTREGRPVKLDGNPDHPVNRGALCARGQAGTLGLYDPARLRMPVRGAAAGMARETSWAQVDAEVRARLEECRLKDIPIALVTGPLLSPGAQGVVRAFTARYPVTRLYSYDVHGAAPRRSAWKRCYGDEALPAIAWEKARVIVALESDFLGTEGFTVEATRRFASGRDAVAGGEMNRLYAVEGAMSLTGANADYRIRLSPDAQGEFVLALLSAVGASLPAGVSAPGITALAGRHGLSREALERLVADLLAHRGAAMVHAGDTLPEEIHVAVNHLNAFLGNQALYEPGADPAGEPPLSTPEELRTLASDMRAGRIGLVIHAGRNPVYHLPRFLDYAGALQKVPLSVSLAEMEDETGALCTYILPVHTMLESWGDHRVRAGVLSLQQPVVAPLYDTRQKEGVLLFWSRTEAAYQESLYRDFLKSEWERNVYRPEIHAAGFITFWRTALHDGLVRSGEGASPALRFSSDALAVLQALAPAGSGFTLQLRANHFLGDGAAANNGWLQEIPHPVSKIVWDNYAALSPGTAKRLGVATSDLVEVATSDGRQRLPVFVQPGQADRCISVELGYGRWNAGPIGTAVGTDAGVLLPAQGLTGSRIVRDVRVVRVEGTHELVSTQEHHALDDTFLKDLHLKREIVREGTVEQYRKDPGFLHHDRHELFSISKEIGYTGVKWAMSIDLNKCTGCNACVAGCNVENNIPVVGKDQVRAGREMQWIRIDRYYAGEPDDPRLSHQPMLCQHCDQAPCENVCPVVATTHSPDGLNQMTYNRCVGTKYCSNNCPYKVRRFNFYDFRDHLADGYYTQDSVSLMHNPEVTVRSRGVMEKCTFCVQRIMEARQHAAERGEQIRGSDVQTACQQACPAQAIVFGDMNDPDSEVARHRKHALGYHVIEEVNTRPNVTYMARLRNIHSEKLS